MRWLVLAGLVGCYSPRAESCLVSCAGPSDCPGSLSCIDNLCRLDGDSCLGTPDDGSTEAPLDPDAMISTRTCAGSAAAPLGEICFDPPIPDAATFAIGEHINTTNDSRCQSPSTYNGIDVCLIVTDFVDQQVRFTGTRPIVLWSPGTLTVTLGGIIDVSSAAGPAAAANRGPCAVLQSAEFDAALGLGGGGAGGTLPDADGGGGDGGAAPGGVAEGGLAGRAVGGDSFRGGCPGDTGGAPAAILQSNGGGAAYVIARTRIVIDGRIDASGGGASAAGPGNGGNGGGSGGELVLDAPEIAINPSAIVLALGGGGGSGSLKNMGSGGLAGKPGKPPTFAAFPAGPSATLAACNEAAGGAGSPGDHTGAGPGKDSSDVSCSGGGGGGGDGIIRTYGAAMPTIAIPANVRPVPNAPNTP